jgi:hypothetical protein
MAVVVIVAAMRHGPSARRVRDLERLVGASRRSIERWRLWWEEVFPRTLFWKREGPRFRRGPEPPDLPRVIIMHFQGGSSLEAFVEALKFLSAVTSGPDPPSCR